MGHLSVILPLSGAVRCRMDTANLGDAIRDATDRDRVNLEGRSCDTPWYVLPVSVEF